MAESLNSLGEHAPWLRKIGLHSDAVEIDFAAMQVYADWLQEHNESDPRAKFWRAMGRHRLCVNNYRPSNAGIAEWVVFNGDSYRLSYPVYTGICKHVYVPQAMFDILTGGDCYRNGLPVPEHDQDRNYWRDYPTRRQAMMALCVAFCEATAADQEAFVTWLEGREAEQKKLRQEI